MRDGRQLAGRLWVQRRLWKRERRHLPIFHNAYMRPTLTNTQKLEKARVCFEEASPENKYGQYVSILDCDFSSPGFSQK